MLPMSMSLTNSITVPSPVSSLVIPLDKKHTNCLISPPEKYSPAGMYVFTKITFLMLPSSLSFLLLIWATLQVQFLLQFMTQLPFTSLILLALSLLPPQTLLPLFLSHPIQTHSIPSHPSLHPQFLISPPFLLSSPLRIQLQLSSKHTLATLRMLLHLCWKSQRLLPHMETLLPTTSSLPSSLSLLLSSSNPSEPSPPLLGPPQPAPTETLRRSNRSYNPPAKLHDYVCSHIMHACSDQSPSLLPGLTKGTRYPLANYVSYHRYKPAHCSFIAQISQVIKPRNYSEAVVHPEWQEAMGSELQAL